MEVPYTEARVSPYSSLEVLQLPCLLREQASLSEPNLKKMKYGTCLGMRAR